MVALDDRVASSKEGSQSLMERPGDGPRPGEGVRLVLGRSGPTKWPGKKYGVGGRLPS